MEGVGYLEKSASVTPVDIQLSIHSASPSSKHQNGGYEITLNGNGFPLTESKNFSIILCSKRIEATLVMNTQIVFVAPTC